MVIDSMLASGQLEDDLQEKVKEAMLRRHHHQNEKKLSNRIPLVRSFADIGKKYSDPHLLERNGETVALLSFWNSLFTNRHGLQAALSLLRWRWFYFVSSFSSLLLIGWGNRVTRQRESASCATCCFRVFLRFQGCMCDQNVLQDKLF